MPPLKVAALAGGVGGAKLLVGLQEVLEGGRLSAIVNTGDDTTMYGLHVAPDLDIVTYWLAGIADSQRGWGLESDTFAVVDALARLGRESWFRLGDGDLATCLLRTERMAEGATLSAVTDDIRRALGVPTRVLPMSDERVRTLVDCSDGRTLEFQEYFVRERTRPEVAGIRLAGVEDAKPAPGVIDAIATADVVVLCPSNPFLSIAPILALDGVRAECVAHRMVVAVSPIVAGVALKGPADRLLESLGHRSSAAGVAALYQDLCDVFVLDSADEALAAEVSALGMRVRVLDTVMTDRAASERLARALLNP